MRIALIAVLASLAGCMLAAQELQVDSRSAEPQPVESRPVQHRAMPPEVPFLNQPPMLAQSKNVYQGVGGTRKMLVGAQEDQHATLWTHGSPPCRYEVLDVVHDKRGAGQLSMSGLEGDMVNEAAIRRGTDIILLERHVQAEERSSLQRAGYGNAYGSGAAMAPIEISNTSYAVVRCIDQPRQFQDSQLDQWRR